MKKVRITKLSQLDNPHSTDKYLEDGGWKEGMMMQEPTVGERFNLYPLLTTWSQSGINTSGVKEILSENTFATHNSVYKWEIID